MRLIIQEDYSEMSHWVAQYVVEKINRHKAKTTKPFVLGLPTGSTPLGTYKELVRLNREGNVSFQNVVTFNMDEYVGIPQNHPQSYHTFMWKHLFSKIDINPDNVNILDGNAPDLVKECNDYELKIESYGGINLFLGGIGSDGHIAFNEPGSSLSSRTRLKTLNNKTVMDNARFFDADSSQVPTVALTVGVGTILDAEEVLLLVSGHSKALALRYIIEEPVNHMWTGSALQLHKKAVIVCDEASTHELRVGTVKYFKGIEKLNVARESQPNGTKV